MKHSIPLDTHFSTDALFAMKIATTNYGMRHYQMTDLHHVMTEYELIASDYYVKYARQYHCMIYYGSIVMPRLKGAD